MSELDVYLTLDGRAFMAPQYSISADTQKVSDWSCPDYVVLDFRHKQIVVIEETTASRPVKLIGKVIDRGAQWYTRLASFLVQQEIVPANWHIRCLLIMRSEVIERYKTQFTNQPDVDFLALEDCSFPWKFYENRMKHGIHGYESVSPLTVGEWASHPQTDKS